MKNANRILKHITFPSVCVRRRRRCPDNPGWRAVHLAVSVYSDGRHWFWVCLFSVPPLESGGCRIPGMWGCGHLCGRPSFSADTQICWFFPERRDARWLPDWFLWSFLNPSSPPFFFFLCQRCRVEDFMLWILSSQRLPQTSTCVCTCMRFDL